MKTWERWSFGILSALVAVTGFAYLWMKYFIVNLDPMALVNHPWQSTMLTLHVITSPALILVFGIVLDSHVLKKLRHNRPPNRRTGLASFGTFAVMVVTGYALQVVTAEPVLKAMVIVHVASAVVFSASYVVHLVISLRIARAGNWRQVREIA